MPLLVIVGSTNLGTTFYVGFTMLCSETGDDYLWVLQVLKSLLDQPGYTYPSVVVTDQELALINALQLIFPDSKRLLCEWHVQKNVISNINRSFKGDEKLRD